MADKPWKRLERYAAKVFGTTRALMKGTKEKKDIGPEDDFPLCLDSKLRPKADWRLSAWFIALESAAAEGAGGSLGPGGSPKWPVLLLQEPGMKRKYCFVRMPRLSEFINNRTTGFSAESFYVWDGSNSRKAILKLWADLQREVAHKKKECKVPRDVIPMLQIHSAKMMARLAIIHPEDLARIFYDGRLINKAFYGGVEHVREG